MKLFLKIMKKIMKNHEEIMKILIRPKILKNPEENHEKPDQAKKA